MCFISDFFCSIITKTELVREYISDSVCVLLREKVKCNDVVPIDSCCIFDSLFPDRIYPKEEL